MVKQVNAIYTNGFVKKTDYDSKINEIKGEIPSITGLATTAALNDAKNKTPNLSDLVKKKKDYDAKIKDNEDEYFTTSDYNKFTNKYLTQR